MKKIFVSLIMFFPMMMFGQEVPSSFELSYSGKYSFNDKIIITSPSDTFQISKVGQGNSNFLNFSFFLPQTRPEFRLGFTGFFERIEEGRFLLNPEDYAYYDYRTLELYRGGMFLNFAFDELIFGAELHLGGGITYEKGKLNWMYRNLGDARNTSLESNISRFGLGLNPRFVFSRPEDVSFLPKVDLSGGLTYWLKPDADNDCFSYNVDLSLNIFKMINLGNFYISPVIGGSIRENDPVSIGTSPVVSGGLVISANYIRADLIKIVYQRRVYGQTAVPYSGIDGIFFSVNIGAFWQ